RRRLAGWAPDVVHAHGMRAAALAALALPGPGRRASRLAVTVHNAPPVDGGANAAFYRGLERIVARRADAVSYVSADLAARLRRVGARAGGRALVPAPTWPAPTASEIARARRELSDGAPVVLAVGRLAAQKGFGVLLAAAARWRDRDPFPVLAIVGEGPL